MHIKLMCSELDTLLTEHFHAHISHSAHCPINMYVYMHTSGACKRAVTRWRHAAIKGKAETAWTMCIKCIMWYSWPIISSLGVAWDRGGEGGYIWLLLSLHCLKHTSSHWSGPQSATTTIVKLKGLFIPHYINNLVVDCWSSHR